MDEVIKELWYGNIAPFEKCGVHDPEINRILIRQEQNREQLQRISTEKQMELLQKYTDCAEEYLLLMMERAFCRGFQLGGRLLAECFYEGENA